ncbi:MAG: FadR family transcriptional regulator [Clostridia bacterium]|nr:FadR family transcriptional regulator [Clostridia bacterium]
MKIDPVRSKRLYQDVVEQLILQISCNQLKPGEKLPPERELAQQFGVSRASIREAFRVLEMIGLLEVRPGGGTYITDLNIVPFITTLSPLFVRQERREQDLLDFRLLIETEAARLAAKNHLPQGLEAMRTAIGVMEASIEEREASKGAEADIGFHQAVFKCSDNVVLMKVAECVSCLLENSVRLNRVKILRDAENARVLLEQHRHILKAIESGKETEAMQAMLEHLQFVEQSLQESENNPSKAISDTTE